MLNTGFSTNIKILLLYINNILHAIKFSSFRQGATAIFVKVCLCVWSED